MKSRRGQQRKYVMYFQLPILIWGMLLGVGETAVPIRNDHNRDKVTEEVDKSGIKCIPGCHCPSAKELSCKGINLRSDQDPEILHGAEEIVKNVTTLNLMFNNFTVIPLSLLKGFKEITILNLQWNEITAVEDNTLANNQKIEVM